MPRWFGTFLILSTVFALPLTGLLAGQQETATRAMPEVQTIEPAPVETDIAGIEGRA